MNLGGDIIWSWTYVNPRPYDDERQTIFYFIFATDEEDEAADEELVTTGKSCPWKFIIKIL